MNIVINKGHRGGKSLTSRYRGYIFMYMGNRVARYSHSEKKICLILISEIDGEIFFYLSICICTNITPLQLWPRQCCCCFH